jgi:UDP-glucose 4-epimerase
VTDPVRHGLSPAVATVVVGSRGLLGRAVVRAVHEARDLALLAAPSVPWDDDDAAATALGEAAELLAGHDGPWQLLWCAGAGVNGMTRQAADREVAQFETFVRALAARSPASPGSVFLASSAGGVYAGSADEAPYDEDSAVGALSEYGATKLRLEAVLGLLDGTDGVSSLVGRFANLYGPGQDLGKQQGLVSHLCLGALERRPVSIFVPLDTLRDYVFVSDAAEKALASLDALRRSGRRSAVKVIGSGAATTVASVLGDVAAAAGTRPPVILGASPLSAMQSHDLRLRSAVFPEVDLLPVTPFPAGIAATWADLFARFVARGRRPS